MEHQNNTTGIGKLPFIKRVLFSILRIFFRMLYHQFAWTYDWVAYLVSLGDWQSWILTTLPYLDGPRTLELGFGPGHLQIALNRKGIKIYGLDESLQMNKLAKQRLARLGMPVNLVRGNAQAIPFEDECFHQVVMTFPAEFMLNQSTLLEVYRVLVKGGIVVIVPMAWITGRKLVERFVAWINHVTGEAPEWDEKYLEPLHKLGFEVSWQMLNLKSSKVLIIKLRKPASI